MSHHAIVGALQLSAPCQTWQRFLILYINQLTNAAVQGILGVSMTELALTRNMQHGHATLVATIVDTALCISQTLENTYETVQCHKFLPASLRHRTNSPHYNHAKVNRLVGNLKRQGFKRDSVFNSKSKQHNMVLSNCGEKCCFFFYSV